MFESVAAALPGKRIAVAITDNGTNMIKGNERWRNRKMALCCLYVEQGDKKHIKRVNSNNSCVDCFQES